MFEPTAHDTILVVVQVAAILILAYILRTTYQAKQRRQHELARQILDKMSSEEFLELLRSPEGSRSIERLVGSHKPPGEWITQAIRRAVLLLFAGGALLVIHPRLDFSGHEMFLIMGGVAIGLGIGYLIAAALTGLRAKKETADPAA